MLHVRQRGTGPAALFLHGFSLDGSMWTPQAVELADVATCLVPDLRGSGSSPAVDELGLSMERHARDVVAVLDALDVERAHVVGHSMGGYVALAMAELHADRVRSLALVGSRAAGDDDAARARRDQASQLLEERGRDAFAYELLRRLLPEAAAPDVRARVREMIVATADETLLAGLQGMRNRRDRRPLLANLDVPTLVLCGELDELTPTWESREMAGAIPDAELVIVPGAGHMAPLETPSAVTHALRRHMSRCP